MQIVNYLRLVISFPSPTAAAFQQGKITPSPFPGGPPPGQSTLTVLIRTVSIQTGDAEQNTVIVFHTDHVLWCVWE